MYRSKHGCNLTLADACKIVDELRSSSRVTAVRDFMELCRFMWDIAYRLGEAHAMRNQRQREAERNKPKQGDFQVHTFNSPEELFAFLDNLERHARTGEMPFNDDANKIAAIKGEPPYFV